LQKILLAERVNQKMKLHKSKCSKITWVAVLSALVAAVTTCALFMLHAKSKWSCGCEYDDAFAYDPDDYDCCCGNDLECPEDDLPEDEGV
jgi:hypothetical protein